MPYIHYPTYHVLTAFHVNKNTGYVLYTQEGKAKENTQMNKKFTELLFPPKNLDGYLHDFNCSGLTFCGGIMIS